MDDHKNYGTIKSGRIKDHKVAHEQDESQSASQNHSHPATGTVAATRQRTSAKSNTSTRQSSSSQRRTSTPTSGSGNNRRRLSKKERMRRRRIRKIKALGLLAALLILCIIIIVSIGKFISGLFNNDDPEDKAAKTATSLSVDGQDAPVEEATATILATGDAMLHKPFLESSTYLASDGSYNYDSIFKYVKDDFEAADFTTITFEGSFTDGDYSGYPAFRSPGAFATAFYNSGIDMCLLANNHIYDNSADGIQKTISYVEENNLLYTGVRKSTDEKPYQVQDINGIKVGMINYVFETERNGAPKAINGIAVSEEAAPLINSFSSEDLDSFYSEMETRLADMKEDGAEFIIAYMHWGVEYDTVGTDEQREMAQKLCDLGVDALIGSHPHVIQPVDLLTSTDGGHQMVCAYAIGNQVSNQRQEYMQGYSNYGHTEDGYMVELTINRDTKGNVTLNDADFIPIWLYHSSNGGGEYYVLPLDEPDTLAEKTGLSLGTDVEDSLNRTNTIISDGVEEVKAALPLS